MTSNELFAEYFSSESAFLPNPRMVLYDTKSDMLITGMISKMHGLEITLAVDQPRDFEVKNIKLENLSFVGWL